MPIARRTFAALAAGATVAAALPPRQGRAAAATLREAPPRPLPPFAFTAADGAPRTAADFAGRGLLINLWATWCPPCVAEMPALDRLQGLVEGEGITVLALSSDRGGAAVVAKFYRERGIGRLGTWLDPQGAAGRALGARGLPTSLVVDRAGLERARLEGPAEWDDPALVAQLRRLCGPAPGAAGMGRT